jgi:hypothetical protein
MSTLFGIHREGKKIELVDDDLPEEYFQDDRIDNEFIEVAFRGNIGSIVWEHEIAKFLDDSIPVYPLDNTAQGIYTIGDLKKEINKQNTKSWKLE